MNSVTSIAYHCSPPQTVLYIKLHHLNQNLPVLLSNQLRQVKILWLKNMKTKSGIAIMIILTLTSCGEKEFTSFNSADTHYRIYHKNSYCSGA